MDVCRPAEFGLSGTVPSTRALPEPPDPADDAVRVPKGTLCDASSLFFLREKLGEGGMGTVWAAYDQKLKREVALKLLTHYNDELLERFLREREIMAGLDHPSLVRVLSAGFLTAGEHSVPFYTMPLIRGRNLESIVVQRGLRLPDGAAPRTEFSRERLLQLLVQVSLAMQSAHDGRVVHRDLKPSNVLVGPYEDVYVYDFGLAKYLDEVPCQTARFSAHVMRQIARARRANLTNGSLVGTPYYMAPEQALPGRKLDHRADVFGLGGILYFVLTGEPPQYAQPPIDRPRIEARRELALARLRDLAAPGQTVSSLLLTTKADLPDEARTAVEEYEEADGLLEGSEYHRFRAMMRECRILSPRDIVRDQRHFQAGPADRDPFEEPPPDLEGICLRAMSRKPEDRFDSCREFALALRPFAEGGGR